MKNVAIVGIGNPLRTDDGIGILLLEKLMEKRNEFLHPVEFIDGGTGGVNLLHILARYDIVILLDAIEFKGRPGDHRLFTLDDIQANQVSGSISTHEQDVLKIIHLSKKLGELPEELLFFGIQPKDTSPGIGVSKQIQQMMDQLTYHFIDEVHKVFKTINDKEEVS
jgi:hydrogenase maturation protease